MYIIYNKNINSINKDSFYKRNIKTDNIDYDNNNIKINKKNNQV